MSRKFKFSSENLDDLVNLVECLTTPECVKTAVGLIGQNYCRGSELDNVIDESVCAVVYGLRREIVKATGKDNLEGGLNGIVTGALQDFALLFGTWDSVRIGKWAISNCQSAGKTDEILKCLKPLQGFFVSEVYRAVVSIADAVNDQIEEELKSLGRKKPEGKGGAE